jgi:hypothetical protein
MDKREILEKLARAEITQEEAERLLNEVGGPIPEKPPEPPPPPQGGGNRGCLIALIIALLVAAALLVLGPACFCLLARVGHRAVQEQRAAEAHRAVEAARAEAERAMEAAREEERNEGPQVSGPGFNRARIHVDRKDGEIIHGQEPRAGRTHPGRPEDGEAEEDHP